MDEKRETPEGMNHPTWKEMYEEMQKDRDQWMNLALDLETAYIKRIEKEREDNEAQN
jgi:hypothetical protein